MGLSARRRVRRYAARVLRWCGAVGMAGTAMGAAAVPVVTPGYTPVEELAVGVRYRALRNNPGQGRVYLGVADVGIGAQRVQLGPGGFNWASGSYSFVYRYSPGQDQLNWSVTNNQNQVQHGLVYNQVSQNMQTFGKTHPPSDMNVMVMEILERSPDATIALNNVTINGDPIGNYSGNNGTAATWMISGVNFGQGFQVAGDLVLSGTFTGGAELNRVDLKMGYGPQWVVTPVNAPASAGLMMGGLLVLSVYGHRRLRVV